MESGEHRASDKRLVQISVKLIQDYQDALGTDVVGPLLYAASALEQAKQVFIAGNGGSASTSIHFASDLRAVGVKAISLCENISAITRVANDEFFRRVFLRQLQEMDFGLGDALVLISGSGDSPNIIEAAAYAKDIGNVVIGLIGFGGGELKELCDYTITSESCDYGIVEGLHSYYCHLIPQLVKEIRIIDAETGNN